MSPAPGTMGYGVVVFVGIWTLMMAARMLPSVAPLASLYGRTVGEHRSRRLTLLTAGYLLAWGGVGIAAYGLARAGGWAVDHHPGWAQAAAVGSCLACAAY